MPCWIVINYFVTDVYMEMVKKHKGVEVQLDSGKCVISGPQRERAW